MQDQMKEIEAVRVEIFDTSLRDGLQQPNIDISVPNAVGLLQHMATFGVHYAEIGFAGANQFVSDLTAALYPVNTSTMKLALFGRTRGRGAKVQQWSDVQFMVSHKQRVPVAVIVVKSRLLDVLKSLETTPEENLLMAYETVECLQDSGLEVIVDLEHAMDAACGRRENGNDCDADFSQLSLDYFHQMVAQCASQQVSRIVVCDTTGGADPTEVGQVIEGLVRSYPGANFGFHGHTDRGLGVANARAAILAGATQIQGTILGTGERCGNVNLTTVIGSMQLRGEAEFVTPAPDLPASLTPPTRPSGWSRRTARPSSVPAHSALGPACMAAANARTQGLISGAIPRESAPARSSESTVNPEEPTS